MAKVVYDPGVINLSDLLTVFFFSHDPTSRDKQGGDVGSQYRSVIFYENVEQRVAVQRFVDDLSNQKAYDKAIVTEIREASQFYPAEDYHREYFETHRGDPYCELVIAPKVEKLQERFANLINQKPK